MIDIRVERKCVTEAMRELYPDYAWIHGSITSRWGLRNRNGLRTVWWASQNADDEELAVIELKFLAGMLT